ncbi:23722_t:CDS:1, partial [Dentiscutata erythropus]
PDNYNDPNDDEAPGNYKKPKNLQKLAPVNGDFELASLYIQQANSQVSLANALDNLEVASDESSYVLAKHDQNIHKKGDRNKKPKDIEKNSNNKDFIEKFLTRNTFHNCTFNF